VVAEFPRFPEPRLRHCIDDLMYKSSVHADGRAVTRHPWLKESMQIAEKREEIVADIPRATETGSKKIIVMDPMEAAPTQEDAKGFSAKEAGESQRSGQPSRPEAKLLIPGNDVHRLGGLYKSIEFGVSSEVPLRCVGAFASRVPFERLPV
jgi:hypothetical protein